MTTRQVWPAAKVFVDSIGVPPGGPSVITDAAWRVVLMVRGYEATADILWRKVMLQAMISGKTKEGFDAVVQEFRHYRETAFPWMEAQREEEELFLKKKVDAWTSQKLSVRPLSEPKPMRSGGMLERKR